MELHLSIQAVVNASHWKGCRRYPLILILLTLSSPGYCQETSEARCSFSQIEHQTLREAKQFGKGVLNVPRSAIRPANLKWELPIAAATGILIAEVDRPAADRIQSMEMQRLAGRWSNAGLGMEFASSGLAYGIGCRNHRVDIRNNGFIALASMGAAGTVDLGLKLAFDRQFPYSTHSTGQFWGGGRSFPSGHAAVSFAWASATAHRTHNKWVKVAAYALASGVSLSRYPAKKHFPSDILVGATVGYVTGTYLAGH